MSDNQRLRDALRPVARADRTEPERQKDAAVFADLSGRVQLVNRALASQFGYAPEALIGQPLSRLHVDRRLEHRAAFQALTTPYRRADGTVFSGETQRSEVTGAGGEVLGCTLGRRYVGGGIGVANALTFGRLAGTSAAKEAMALRGASGR